MLRFYKELYWDETIPEKKQNQIKWRLKVSKPTKTYYVVTLNEGSDQLDIFNTQILMQKYFKKHPKLIIGIAASHAGATKIVIQIAEECYQKNKNGDLKTYLAEKSQMM